MNILIVGPVPPLRGGISDFNNELISTINKKHNISILFSWKKSISQQIS